MKLFEVLGRSEIGAPTPSNISHAGEMARAVQSNSKELGNGAYANVYSDPSDENRVTKIGEPSDKFETDGYIEYVKRILNQHNPCFPQIDEVTLHTAPDKRLFFKVNMERLEELSDMSAEEMEMLIRNTFTEEVADEIMEDTLSMSTRAAKAYEEPRRQPRIQAGMLRTELSNKLSKATRGDRNYLKHTIGNKAVVQALMTLIKMRHEGFMEDLHTGNIMVRRTANGPMVVFTDPFADYLAPDRPKASLPK